jgi:mono/diheme cytochrome c family protein
LSGWRIKLALTVWCCASVLEATESAEALFRDKVQPTFKQHCLGCHGEGELFGQLDLRTRDGLVEGGSRGRAIVPGDAGASLLYRVVEQSGELRMPPAGRLPGEAVAAIGEWIDGGAPFGDGSNTAGLDWDEFEEEDLWAFLPVSKIDAPGDVDSFLRLKLAEAALTPAPRADRRTLIRRATIDLTGLPPTPEQVEAFVTNPAGDKAAFGKVVDRLLASPRYGERWGRHWLDVTRYGDTAGFSNDYERPNAWRYRDYVIRSFNNDKPYDRFVLEQVAGDELFPDDPEAILATGFLRMGPWEHTGMSVTAITRQQWLDDVTHSTATAFLGLTLGCAKCHDHKFDPIPTKDYYRVQAAFATTAFAKRPLPFLPEEDSSGFAAGKKRIEGLIAQLERKRAHLAQVSRRHLMEQFRVSRFEDVPQASRKLDAGLTDEEMWARRIVNKHLSHHAESVKRYQPLAFSVTSGLVEDWNDVGPGGAGSYMKQPDYENVEMHVLVGGSFESPGERVAPGVLSAIDRYSGFRTPKLPETTSGRRSALAKWIADSRNPLTARVMANRVWQHHFGRGLAANANNFGKMGSKPTHPALLDWLAGRFVEEGWSIKALHRIIMASDAYQRASKAPDGAAERDPENSLLSHFTPRRVEAEVLRDSLLVVAGELSLSMGGPGTNPQISRDAAEQPRFTQGGLRPPYYEEGRRKDRNRRSVYSFQQRSLIDPMIEVLNGASVDLSCERRDSTTVPTQAFALFNGELSYDLALAFAHRLQNETDRVVERAFKLAYGRSPTDEEGVLAERHIREMTAYHLEHPPVPPAERKALVRALPSQLSGATFRFTEDLPPWEHEENLHANQVGPETRALADLALVLFNSNEFAYVY